jgi:hypothetical protein
MMTRRNFMGALAFATAAGGLGLGGVLVARRRLDAATIDAVTALSLQNRRVKLAGAGRVLCAEVCDVQTVRRPARRGAPATEQISICLAVDDAQAPAGIYRLQDSELQLGDLYFTPVGRAGKERRLEAVINRIV